MRALEYLVREIIFSNLVSEMFYLQYLVDIKRDTKMKIVVFSSYIESFDDYKRQYFLY